MIKYNLTELNLKNPQIKFTSLKHEYYLTLSVILEKQQDAEKSLNKFKTYQDDLLNGLVDNEDKKFHIYKPEEIHFSLVNFYTYKHNKKESVWRFKEKIRSNSLVKCLEEKINDVFQLYKIKPDFSEVRLGFIHADDGSVAVQVFINDSLVQFCDLVVKIGKNLGFSDSGEKIYPKDSSDKCRCAVNILKIFEPGHKLLKKKKSLNKMANRIIKWNKEYSNNLLDLPGFRLKELTFNISDPYLSKSKNKYYRVKSFYV